MLVFLGYLGSKLAKALIHPEVLGQDYHAKFLIGIHLNGGLSFLFKYVYNLSEASVCLLVSISQWGLCCLFTL